MPIIRRTRPCITAYGVLHWLYDPAPHNHRQRNQCRTPYAVKHDLVLLMMGIIMSETCWDRSLIINIGLVASCWFISLHIKAVHAPHSLWHTNSPFCGYTASRPTISSQQYIVFFHFNRHMQYVSTAPHNHSWPYRQFILPVYISLLYSVSSVPESGILPTWHK